MCTKAESKSRIHSVVCWKWQATHIWKTKANAEFTYQEYLKVTMTDPETFTDNEDFTLYRRVELLALNLSIFCPTLSRIKNDIRS